MAWHWKRRSELRSYCFDWQLGLPVRASELKWASLREAMGVDKKTVGGVPQFVLGCHLDWYGFDWALAVVGSRIRGADLEGDVGFDGLARGIDTALSNGSIISRIVRLGWWELGADERRIIEWFFAGG